MHNEDDYPSLAPPVRDQRDIGVDYTEGARDFGVESTRFKDDEAKQLYDKLYKALYPEASHITRDNIPGVIENLNELKQALNTYKYRPLWLDIEDFIQEVHKVHFLNKDLEDIGEVSDEGRNVLGDVDVNEIQTVLDGIDRRRRILLDIATERFKFKIEEYVSADYFKEYEVISQRELDQDPTYQFLQTLQGLLGYSDEKKVFTVEELPPFDSQNPYRTVEQVTDKLVEIRTRIDNEDELSVDEEKLYAVLFLYLNAKTDEEVKARTAGGNADDLPIETNTAAALTASLVKGFNDIINDVKWLRRFLNFWNVADSELSLSELNAVPHEINEIEN